MFVAFRLADELNLIKRSTERSSYDYKCAEDDYNEKQFRDGVDSTGSMQRRLRNFELICAVRKSVWNFGFFRAAMIHGGKNSGRGV